LAKNARMSAASGPGVAPTYRAVATVRAPAGEVARRLGGSAGELEPLGERSCRLRSHTDTLEWLAFRLTLLGCEFEVDEPPARPVPASARRPRRPRGRGMRLRSGKAAQRSSGTAAASRQPHRWNIVAARTASMFH
jgi:hypothetical protein